MTTEKKNNCSFYGQNIISGNRKASKMGNYFIPLVNDTNKYNEIKIDDTIKEDDTYTVKRIIDIIKSDEIKHFTAKNRIIPISSRIQGKQSDIEYRKIIENVDLGYKAEDKYNIISRKSLVNFVSDKMQKQSKFDLNLQFKEKESILMNMNLNNDQSLLNEEKVIFNMTNHRGLSTDYIPTSNISNYPQLPPLKINMNESVLPLRNDKHNNSSPSINDIDNEYEELSRIKRALTKYLPQNYTKNNRNLLCRKSIRNQQKFSFYSTEGKSNPISSPKNNRMTESTVIKPNKMLSFNLIYANLKY